MILVIDNYDSFTYNLVHYVGELGAPVEVARNDQITAEDAVSMKPDGIILSPGPCTPDEAGICLALVRLAAPTTPIFGVCLGHQSVGQAFGGRVVRAPALMHGKTSRISHAGKGVFAGVADPFSATRYHSLTVDPDSMPDVLEITARSPDGVVMGLQHRSLPVYGVQFHPESIASEHGHAILKNFLTFARRWNESSQSAA